MRAWLRWMMMMILALGLCAAPALGAADAPWSFALPTQEGMALVSETGEVLVPPGVYGLLYEITGGKADAQLFAAAATLPGAQGVQGTEGGARFALLSARGEVLTDFAYDYLQYDIWGNGTVLFSQDALYGAMDSAGNIVLSAQYTYLVGNGEGGYLAFHTPPYDDTADGVYYVDADGQERATGVKVLYGLWGMAEGLVPAVSSDNGLYGYLGPQGRWRIQPQYTWADIFQNGVARAAIEAGEGLINAQGNWLITPKYDAVNRSYENPHSPIVALDDGTLHIIDPRTYQITATYPRRGAEGYQVSFVSDFGYAVLVGEDRVVLVDAEGREHLSIEERDEIDFWLDESGLVTVYLGEWGEPCEWLYTTEGELLSGPYQSLLYAGGQGAQARFIVSTFEVTRVEYEEYGVAFNDEVPGTRRYGLIDARGEVIAEIQYLDLYPLPARANARRLFAETDDFVALLTPEGQILTRFDTPPNPLTP